MNETEIAWTEFTWNPMSGCKKVSDGCRHCYAYTLAENKRGTAAFPNGFDLTIREHKLKEPSRLKQPSLIFVNSMSDPFLEELPEDYRAKIFKAIEENPKHRYQMLTKRPKGMLQASKKYTFPEHLWCGVTVENKKALKRIDLLRQVKCAHRFISIEPLLEDLGEIDLTDIDWVIVGGESGTHINNQETAKKRALVFKNGTWKPEPSKIAWVESIQKQCKKEKIPFFFKQWGGPYPKAAGNVLNGKKFEEFPSFWG